MGSGESRLELDVTASRLLLNALHRCNISRDPSAPIRHVRRRGPPASLRRVQRVVNPVAVDRDSFTFVEKEGRYYLSYTLSAACNALVTMQSIGPGLLSGEIGAEDKEVIKLPQSSHIPVLMSSGKTALDLAACVQDSPRFFTVEVRSDDNTYGVAQVSYVGVENLEGEFKAKLVQQKLKIDEKDYITYEIFGVGQVRPDLEDCVVCLTQKRDTAVMPCRHMCLCAACADIFRAQTRCKCPMCRAGTSHIDIESLLEISKDATDSTASV